MHVVQVKKDVAFPFVGTSGCTMHNLATQHALIRTKPRSVMWSTTTRASFLSDASCTSVVEVVSVMFGVFGKTPGVPRFEDFLPLYGRSLSLFVRRSLPFPIALLAFATRLCRLAISGWQSHAFKSANANNWDVALWHA